MKFGFDVQRNYLNHYETAVPVFTFNGGATALSGGASPNNFNQFADFLLGLPQSRNAQVMTPLLEHRRREGRAVAGDGPRAGRPGCTCATSGRSRRR